MMKIYIVMGTTGEYSDRIEWPVVAYKDKKLAENHVHNATQTANIIFSNMQTDFTLGLCKNSYDPKMKMDYTGTYYFIYETTLWENGK